MKIIKAISRFRMQKVTYAGKIKAISRFRKPEITTFGNQTLL